tara:strand:+ start:1583 stop:1834 length:252 start_codon:yes stop_codon:yes gene_type:complete
MTKDFKEHADKEQQELDESMKEAFRQRDERLKKERYAGSVNFQAEGEFIFCSNCKDTTVHNPKFGKCVKCGLEEYNDRKEGLN